MEMLVGAILALFAYNQKDTCPKRYLSYLGSGAIILLVITLFLKNFFVPPFFPGAMGLIPAILTAIFIYSCQFQSLIYTIFSSKPLVWIGKLSYSLYLWHWIILAIYRYLWQDNHLPFNGIIIVLILIFCLSIITYYFIEQPIRHLNFSLNKSLLYIYILPSSIVFSIFYFSPKVENKSSLPEVVNTKVGDLTKPTNILFIGNSHTMHLKKFADVIGKKEGWSAQIDGIGSCAFILDCVSPFSQKLSTGKLCKERNFFFLKKYENYPIVVISNLWGGLDSSYHQKFEETLRILIKNKKTIYVINSSHLMNLNGQRMKIYKNNYFAKFILKDKLEKNLIKKSSIENVRKINSIVEKYPKVKWIDISLLLPKVLEKYEFGEIFIDGDHLSEFGSEKLAEEFMKTQTLIQ